MQLYIHTLRTIFLYMLSNVYFCPGTYSHNIVLEHYEVLKLQLVDMTNNIWWFMKSHDDVTKRKQFQR